MQLETARLILRLPQPDDADVLHRYVSDYAIAKTTLHIPHPYPRPAADEFIARVRERYEAGADFSFAMTRKSDGAFMGMCGIHPTFEYDRADIGYWIGVPFWGQGYTTEAARRLIDFGFEELKLNRVFAAFFIRNPASRRVMEKAGMTFEGFQRQHIKRLGVYHDIGYCGILRAEWGARGSGE